MPWYMTDDARKDAQNPKASEYPSLATIKRIAMDAGAWEPSSRPSDWQNGDVVFSPAQLYSFARLLALELKSDR